MFSEDEEQVRQFKGSLYVANFDLFSCQTSYTIIEEEVYSEECTVHFEDLLEPSLDLPGPYSLVQLRKKRDIITQALPGYPYHAQEISSPSKCRRILLNLAIIFQD